MKALYIIPFLTLFVNSVVGFNPPGPTISCAVSETEYCQGDLISIDWQVENGVFDASNEFYIQLSDANGAFINSYILDSFSAFEGSGTVSVILPSSMTGGTDFHIRLIGSSPYVIGSPNLQSIVIRPDTQATHVTPIIVCSDLESFQLQGGFPADGTYTGEFVDNGIFYPSVSGAGFHSVTYEVVSDFGCSSTFEMAIQVKTTPEVFPVQVGSLCRNSIPFTLQADPSSGTWTGPGVVNNVFHPEEVDPGVQSISYSYQSPNGCTATESIEIEVLEVPEIFFASVPGVCENGEAIALTTGLPEGGNYYGPFVQGTNFDPTEAGVGYHEVHYGITSPEGCTNSASTEIEVFDATPPGFDLPLTFCTNSEVHNLDPNPTGGTFSEMATSNNTLDPNELEVGTHELTYTVTTENGCVTSTTKQTEVLSIPEVELTMDDQFCSSNSEEITSFGIPASGQLTVDDVLVEQFIPSNYAGGFHNTAYYFEDSNGCIGMDVGGFILNMSPPIPALSYDGVSLTAETDPVATLKWFLNYEEIEQTGTGFIPSESGIYTAKATLNGCDSEMSEEIDLTVSSVQEMAEVGMRIYPVPFVNQIIIDAGENWGLSANMKLYDSNARLVREWNNDQIQKLNGKYIVNSNLDNIARGTYVLILTNQKSTFRALITK